MGSFSLGVIIHFSPLAAFLCQGSSKDSYYYKYSTDHAVVIIDMKSRLSLSFDFIFRKESRPFAIQMSREYKILDYGSKTVQKLWFKNGFYVSLAFQTT